MTRKEKKQFRDTCKHIANAVKLVKKDLPLEKKLEADIINQHMEKLWRDLKLHLY